MIPIDNLIPYQSYVVDMVLTETNTQIVYVIKGKAYAHHSFLIFVWMHGAGHHLSASYLIAGDVMQIVMHPKTKKHLTFLLSAWLSMLPKLGSNQRPSD